MVHCKIYNLLWMQKKHSYSVKHLNELGEVVQPAGPCHLEKRKQDRKRNDKLLHTSSDSPECTIQGMCSFHIPWEPEENWNNRQGHTYRCSRSPNQTSETATREERYWEMHIIYTHNRNDNMHDATETEFTSDKPHKSCRVKTPQCWSYTRSWYAWGQRACGFPLAEDPVMSRSRCRQRWWWFEGTARP